MDSCVLWTSSSCAVDVQLLCCGRPALHQLLVTTHNEDTHMLLPLLYSSLHVCVLSAATFISPLNGYDPLLPSCPLLSSAAVSKFMQCILFHHDNSPTPTPAPCAHRSLCAAPCSSMLGAKWGEDVVPARGSIGPTPAGHLDRPAPLA